ncbi:MAG: PAS domain S-box protein [Arcobacteraceae bacterium]
MWTMIFLSLALGYKVSLLHIKHNETLFKAQVQEKMLFLQSRQAIIGELIGNIAHQWKEPLAEVGAIQTNLQANILIKGTLSQEKILDSTQKSSNIIRHLADTIDIFYRFFTHQKSNKGEFYVINEIRNIQKMVHYSLTVENITLEIHPAQNIVAYGDNNEFANALLNIILNAKDILVERKIENPTIIIHVRQNHNAIIITIEDNAGGITQEPIHKIFDSCVSSKTDNIGIGLYLTKTIIEKRLRGKITVENSSKGALFTIMLPLVWELIEVEENSTSFNIEESTLQRLSTLERQVEKQEEIEKVIRQWEDIFNQTHWGVSVHKGTNNHFEMINPAFCAMYGYSEQELKQMNVYDLFSPASLDILTQKQQEAFEKSFTSFEAIHVKKDGTKFPVTIDLTVIKNEYDEILYHIANIRDISEQKKANQRLLLKKFALEHIHEAVYLMDEKGQFHYVNKGACQALGYSESELLQLNIGDVDADWPVERWPEHWEVIKEIKTMTMELRHKRKDGSIFPVEVLANYFEYDGIAYNMGLARDISERKAIQENLLLKEFALNKISEAVYLIDEKSNFYYFNEAACQELGYEEDELKQLNVIAIDPNMSQDNWTKHWNDIKKHRSSPLLSHHQRKDGTIFPIEVNANYFEYKGVAYNLAVIQNITVRLEAQKRKDEEKMRLFFEHKLVGMAITSPKKGWLHVNEKLCEMLGYSFDELKHMTWAQITHPDDLVADVYGFERMLAGEIESYTVEKRYICKNNSIVFAYLSVSCVRKEDGSVDFVLALIDDITERKKAEEEIKTLNATLEEKVLERTSELAKKEREFRTLAENMPNFLSRYNQKGKRIYVNPVLCNYFGVSSDKLLGTTPQKNPLIGVPLELQEKITYVLQTGQKTHMEIADIKDDRKRWWTLIFAPEFDEKGNIDGVISIGHDITYIKQAEEQLQLLKTAINNASDALYIVGDDRSIHYVSDASCRMLGYTYDEFLTMKVEDIDPYMKVAEIDNVREKVNEFTTTTFQTKHQTKEGKILDVEITVTKFIFNDSDLRLSIVKDITQQIRYEQEIKELNSTLEQKVIQRTKELQQAVEFNKSIILAIPDMLFEISKEGIYLNIWARDEKLLAAQKELLLGKNFKDILPPDAVEVSIKTIKEVEKQGSSLGNMYKLDLPNGEHWFELHTTKKEPKGTYLALVRDITARKQAELSLINLNATLEEKVKERTFALQKALEWNEDIINTLPDLLFEIDSKGNYLNVWAQNKELLVQQKETLLGNNISNVLSKQAVDTIIEALNEANLAKISIGKTIAIDLTDGKKQFELSISKKSDGNYLILSRDITQRN